MPVIVVAGDEGPPTAWRPAAASGALAGVEVLTPEMAGRLFPGLAAALPAGHPARKNAGYLRALQRGACHIWDFDAASCAANATAALLRSVAAGGRLPPSPLELTAPSAVVNPYLLYGAPNFVWPRGYPLELLHLREFPVLRAQNDLSGGAAPGVAGAAAADVVQLLAQGHPDVDAHWRLEHEQDLPMAWDLNAAVANASITINPSKWAPINAHATLISRRAAAAAMLPARAPARVSDVWRGYVLQYLMKRFAGGPGLLAFSGAMVDRSAPLGAVMAAREAEAPLARQCGALLEFLERRHATHESFLVEYVALMDDLYRAGFLERADAAQAQAWARHASRLVRTTPLARGPPALRALPIPKPQNVLAVVHINGGVRRVVPAWMALHGHKFRAVRFYAPLTPGMPCRPISGLKLHCVMVDSVGAIAYESLVHTLEELLGVPSIGWRATPSSAARGCIECFDYEGVIYMHNDVLWRACPSPWPGRSAAPCSTVFGGNKSFCVPKSRLADSNWGMVRSPHIKDATPAFEAMLDHRGQKNASNITYWMGSGDILYVAKADVLRFALIGRLMARARLYLEVAVPTWCMHFLPSASRGPSRELITIWGRDRRNASLTWSSWVVNGTAVTEFVHPLKLTNPDGLVYHASGVS